MTAQLPIPRATVDELVAQRNKALELYANAHRCLVVSSDALKEARKIAALASPGVTTRFNVHSDQRYAEERKAYFALAGGAPPETDFMDAARRIVDTDIWAYIVQVTGLDSLMDKQAKDELHAQLMLDPPEVTVDNVTATLSQFVADADRIFQRGIANVFSKLDRRFRSHDGWKIGDRMILDHMFNEYGHWNHYRDHRASLHDVDRVFHMLDGKPAPDINMGVVAAVDESRGKGWGKRTSFIESDYYRIRTFQNGNCHIWFKRDDLVERVNQLLGRYYDAPLPHEREAKADPLSPTGRKLTPARNFGVYLTPDRTADAVLEYVKFYCDKGRLALLEPSAGMGALASRAAAQKNVDVDCVDISRLFCDHLRSQRLYRSVTCMDFLQMAPAPKYDIVLMNPPFDRERDIDHVMHACSFLKPDGLLVAVMSAGTEFRQTNKSKAFRDMVEQKRGKFFDLPPGSFAESGTWCNTVVVRFRMDGRGIW